MSDPPYRFEYGDYVVCTSVDADMAPLGRVLGAERVAKATDDESYLDAWERAGKPYRVILRGADEPVVANEDTLTHPVRPDAIAQGVLVGMLRPIVS